MANPRKPNSLKVVAGTARKDRAVDEVELPLLDKTPAHPDWLTNSHAVKEWKRLALILINNGLLTEADLSYLGHLCNLHGNLVQLSAAGVPATASLIGALRNMYNDFGVSPVARGKVSPVVGGKNKDNPFAKNGRK